MLTLIERVCFPTQVVSALCHLGHVDLGGSLWDLNYLMVTNPA